MPAFSQQATVYAVDMLGTGFSDRVPQLDCCLRANAERLLLFLDELGVPSCDLLGTSHGGAVAMMAAALAPHRMRRLILVAPVNPWSAHGRCLAPVLSTSAISALFLYLEPLLKVAHSEFLRRMYGDTRRIPPGTLEGYSVPLSTPGSLQHGLKILRSWNQDLQELESVLPRIARIPTLLLWGSKDPVVSAASATQLGRNFDDCRTVMFEGVGHLPYEEVPDDFNRAVSAFLASV